MSDRSDVNGIAVSTLANGLRLVSRDMPGLETLSLGVWVDAGARHEAAAVNGISHLIEHMAFKGTRRRNARQIAEEIESVGGHLNAYTAREQTAYYAKVLKGDMALALDLLGDILQHSVFDEDELARERAVVIQEIGQANDTPDDIIFDYFQEMAFPNQPLGRPVLGSAEGVAAMRRPVLTEYLGQHYAAPRMVLAAAGRLDHDRLVELTEQHFAGLPGLADSAIEPARYRGGEFRSARDLEQVHLVMGFPGFDFFDRDYYVMQVLSTLLGGGMSSRLYQEVREARGLAYSIFSFASSFVDGGLFGVYAGTGEGSCAELSDVICDETLKVAETVSEDEVARARSQLKSSLLMSLESTYAVSEQLARQMLIYDRPLPVAEMIARIDAVDAAACSACMRRILKAGPMTLAAIGPIVGLPDLDRLQKRLA